MTITGELECLDVRVKYPGEVIGLTFDWSGYLSSDDAITASSWDATAGVSVSAGSFTSTTTASIVSSGSTNTDYCVANTITTQLGKTKRRTLRIRVIGV